MKNTIKYLFVLLTTQVLSAQILNRQTVSSQGSTSVTPNGYSVTQSVGQQGALGTYRNDKVVVQQGFQQLLFLNRNADNTSPVVQNQLTKFYPNPFTTMITLEFSLAITGEIDVVIADMSGRQVFKAKKQMNSNLLTIDDLQNLSQGHYILVLTEVNSNGKYTTKITK